MEYVAPGSFDRVLSERPDVHALWDHSTTLVLGRTPDTLELGTDARGLTMWVRVIPTTYGNDLRSLMEAGAIDGASFAFTVRNDSWTMQMIDGRETVVRTIEEIDQLYDVTVCARGAYPAADSEAVRTYVRNYASARLGRPAITNQALAELKAKARRMRGEGAPADALTRVQARARAKSARLRLGL